MTLKKKNSFRKLINDIHLWLGLVSSLVLLVVCVTGCVLTFEEEISKWIQGKSYVHNNKIQEKIPLADLKNTLELQTKGIVSAITIPDEEALPLEVAIKENASDRRGAIHLINPYTGEILANISDSKTSRFFKGVMKLHRWLMLDSKIGRPIVGIATIIFVLLCLSGIILWLPKKIKGFKSFKPGLKIKFGKNLKRLTYDLHNTLGFYSFFVLLIMGSTGLFWSFGWYKDVLSFVLQTDVRQDAELSWSKASDKDNSFKISYEQAIEIANQKLPHTGKISIQELKERGMYKIYKTNTSKFNVHARDALLIDASNSEVVDEIYFDDFTLGQKISEQIKYIHLGSIYGLFSKIIYFVACLIATSLPITGFIIWWNKLKSKKIIQRL